MSAAKTLLTADQFGKYPFADDKRYELDDGALIETDRPGYNHNRVVQRLTFELYQYFHQKPIGEVLISENVYALSAKTCRSPDAAVILGDRREELWNATVIPIIPEIAAEVFSPDESLCGIHRKIRQYFEAGVKEVWLFDLEARAVETFIGPALPETALTGEDALTSPLLPGFRLALTDLFA